MVFPGPGSELHAVLDEGEDRTEQTHDEPEDHDDEPQGDDGHNEVCDRGDKANEGVDRLCDDREVDLRSGPGDECAECEHERKCKGNDCERKTR